MVSAVAIEEPFGSTDPRNGTTRVRFGPHGAINSLHVADTVTVGGRTARVTRRIRLDRIGHTSVERPPWVAVAARDADTSTPGSAALQRSSSTRLPRRLRYSHNMAKMFLFRVMIIYTIPLVNMNLYK